MASGKRVGGPAMLSPLERFLATAYLKRLMASKVIAAEDTVRTSTSDHNITKSYKSQHGLRLRRDTPLEGV